MSKGPCKFYKQGRCNKGSSCQYSHGNNGYSNNHSAPPFWSASLLDEKDSEIRLDLNTFNSFQSKVFSLYGLPEAPVNLITRRDYSPEEMRMEFMMNPQQYEQHMQSRQNDYQKVFTFLKKDTRKAARYLQALAEHASKNDGMTPNPFINFDIDFNGGNNSSFGQNLFGKSSTNSFGASAFGTSAAPAFGSSSFGGSNSQPAFGSSAFGSSVAKQSPFGSLSGGTLFGGSLGTSLFGSGANPFSTSTPAFGAAATSTPAFGSTSASNSSAFGATSTPAFGAPTTNTSAFGSTGFGSTTTGNSPFGSTATGNPLFGLSGFGSGSTQSAFGSFANQTASPFGSLLPNNDSKSPFASAVPSTNSAFQDTKQSSPFGNLQASDNKSASPFGNLQNSTTNASPFGSLFGKTSNGNTQSTANPFGSLLANANSSPFGPTSSTNSIASLTTVDAKNGIYTLLDDITEEIRNLFETDKFQLGKVPELPPPIELC